MSELATFEDVQPTEAVWTTPTADFVPYSKVNVYGLRSSSAFDFTAKPYEIAVIESDQTEMLRNAMRVCLGIGKPPVPGWDSLLCSRSITVSGSGSTGTRLERLDDSDSICSECEMNEAKLWLGFKSDWGCNHRTVRTFDKPSKIEHASQVYMATASNSHWHVPQEPQNFAHIVTGESHWTGILTTMESKDGWFEKEEYEFLDVKTWRYLNGKFIRIRQDIDLLQEHLDEFEHILTRPLAHISACAPIIALDQIPHDARYHVSLSYPIALETEITEALPPVIVLADRFGATTRQKWIAELQQEMSADALKNLFEPYYLVDTRAYYHTPSWAPPHDLSILLKSKPGVYRGYSLFDFGTPLDESIPPRTGWAALEMQGFENSPPQIIHDRAWQNVHHALTEQLFEPIRLRTPEEIVKLLAETKLNCPVFQEHMKDARFMKNQSEPDLHADSHQEIEVIQTANERESTEYEGWKYNERMGKIVEMDLEPSNPNRLNLPEEKFVTDDREESLVAAEQQTLQHPSMWERSFRKTLVQAINHREIDHFQSLAVPNCPLDEGGYKIHPITHYYVDADRFEPMKGRADIGARTMFEQVNVWGSEWLSQTETFYLHGDGRYLLEQPQVPILGKRGGWKWIPAHPSMGKWVEVVTPKLGTKTTRFYQGALTIRDDGTLVKTYIGGVSLVWNGEWWNLEREYTTDKSPRLRWVKTWLTANSNQSVLVFDSGDGSLYFEDSLSYKELLDVANVWYQKIWGIGCDWYDKIHSESGKVTGECGICGGSTKGYLCEECAEHTYLNPMQPAFTIERFNTYGAVAEYQERKVRLGNRQEPLDMAVVRSWLQRDYPRLREFYRLPGMVKLLLLREAVKVGERFLRYGWGWQWQELADLDGITEQAMKDYLGRKRAEIQAWGAIR